MVSCALGPSGSPRGPPGEALARAVPSRSRAGRRAGLCLASSRAPLLIGACAGQLITVLAAGFPPHGFRLSHPETRVASGPIQPACGATGGTPCPPPAPRHRPWLRLSARAGCVPVSEVTKPALNELLATNTQRAGRWLSNLFIKSVFESGPAWVRPRGAGGLARSLGYSRVALKEKSIWKVFVASCRPAERSC